jgi:hypothetical protein
MGRGSSAIKPRSVTAFVKAVAKAGVVVGRVDYDLKEARITVTAKDGTAVESDNEVEAWIKKNEKP